VLKWASGQGYSVSERSEIKRIGGKPHKNSGRGQYAKSDATWNDFIVDVKEYSKSFSISQDAWAKIVTDTMRTDRTKDPALLLVLGGKTRLAVIEWSKLEELVENGKHD
jgi:outer membrane phospholipase A